MLKKYSILLFVFLSFESFAQIPSGSFAPNFTATDLEGQEWNLYDILAEGKTVILDVSATWCGPCWDYHQSGILDELNSTYGPDGTDELMIFLIEGDEATTTEDLYGTGDNTWGDWVDGTHYPIIESRAIAEAFEISFFPTLFMVCPDRKTYRPINNPLESFYNEIQNCPSQTGEYNISLIGYEGAEGIYCEFVNTTPVVYVQNLGSEFVEEVTLTFEVEGLETYSTTEYLGLNTYQIGQIEIAPSGFLSSSDLKIQVELPDDQEDAGLQQDNTYETSIKIAEDQPSNLFTLELLIGSNPFETYWEVLNDEDQVLYNGGNQGAYIPGASNEDAYTSTNTVYSYELVLPQDGCYALHVYDSGLNGLGPGGYYRVINENGENILEGGDFNREVFDPISLSEAEVIGENALIVSTLINFDQFCTQQNFEPQIRVKNIGADTIENLLFQVDGQNNMFGSSYVEITIAPNQTRTVVLDQITITEDEVLTFTILEVNGVEDNYGFDNTINRAIDRNSSFFQSWIVDIFTGPTGYELYWEITNEEDEIIYSGGNELVKEEGPELSMPTADDPGAYPINSPIQENISLPSGHCYTITVLDGGSNGFPPGGFNVPTPFYRIRNNNEGIFVEFTGNFGARDTRMMGSEGSSSIKDTDLAGLELYPNPSKDHLNIVHPFKGANVDIKIIGLASGVVHRSETRSGATPEIQLNTSDLEEGLYLLVVNDGDREYLLKFVVGL